MLGTIRQRWLLASHHPLPPGQHDRSV